MKRFVTYLYECERGNKGKNVGFIRVNVRGKEATMEVYLRNVAKNLDKGAVYVLTYKEMLQGIELKEILVQNGQSDTRIEIAVDDIKDSGFSLADIEGVGIKLHSGRYIASCWKDNYADGIIRGDFMVVKAILEEPEVLESDELVVAQKNSYQDEMEDIEKRITYEKIDLSQIKDLPSPNWHLTTNSFLVHGFWNYGYLVLKKEMEKDKEILSLGVPGIYEKPEAVMATFFGFPNFEVIQQETKEGAFGCWFTQLKL